MAILHEQYESDGWLVLFECTECDYVSMSLGDLHAHIEGHESMLRWFLRALPVVGPDYVEPLMDRTRVVIVESTAEITLDDVEGL